MCGRQELHQLVDIAEVGWLQGGVEFDCADAALCWMAGCDHDRSGCADCRHGAASRAIDLAACEPHHRPARYVDRGGDHTSVP